MNEFDKYQTLNDTIESLSSEDSLGGLSREGYDSTLLPSGKVLEEIVELARAILFPGYYGKSNINLSTIRYHIGVNVERFYKLLSEQIFAGLYFGDCTRDQQKLRQQAQDEALKVVACLPRIRATLHKDVEAAYNGDPAAINFGEVISCYPVIKALTNYRVAHEIYKLGVPLIPRMLTEMAHSETGIDIHPGAQIGDYFTIDHGTGVVIGATCIIGNNVKLYQGVTLGAKSFPLDSHGNPIKGIPRHPIIEDDVVIYANATILGRITIGRGSVVGANVWVTGDLRPHTKKYKKQPKDLLDLEFNNGTGI